MPDAAVHVAVVPVFRSIEKVALSAIMRQVFLRGDVGIAPYGFVSDLFDILKCPDLMIRALSFYCELEIRKSSS